MSNVVRRDPFAIDDVLDDLMKGFFVRPVRYPGASGVQLRMDVREDDRAYRVSAEMPGVRKEDISVTVEGNAISIAAEVRRDGDPGEGEKALQSERYYGKLSRSFSLGQEVDESAARARFENGVLELVLPKKLLSTSRRLAID